jgi:hypothetical protein
MALPASLIQHIEQHGCFTGCFSADSSVNVCFDPARPLQPIVVVSCQDCYMRIGAPQALLPAGTTSSQLARELSDHQKQRRGFAQSRSGYHATGPGFWLSWIQYAPGLFLISAERSRQLGSDLDVFLLGVQNKIVPLIDPQMGDPKQYRLETIYVNFGQFQSGINSKQALLAAPQCRTQPQNGWQKVTLAEFLPLSQPAVVAAAVVAPVTVASAPANQSTLQAPANATAQTRITATAPVPSAKPKAKLKIGDVCPVCGGEFKVRPLFNGSFTGCLCG